MLHKTLQQGPCRFLCVLLIALGPQATKVWSSIATVYFGPDCQVSEVLRYVEAGALLPPLVVLQALAKNSHLRLDVVKAYIQRQLKGAAASIDADRTAITRFQTETAAMRAEATELKTQAG